MFHEEAFYPLRRYFDHLLGYCNQFKEKKKIKKKEKTLFR